MNAARVHADFRGVSCRYCGKPVRMSASFISRETAIKLGETRGLSSRVFPARCRCCQAEAIYTLNQIVDFLEHEPGPR